MAHPDGERLEKDSKAKEGPQGGKGGATSSGLERRYRELFEKAPTPLLISRLNGDILEANPAFYKLLDYPADGSAKLNFMRDRLYQTPEVRTKVCQRLLEDGMLEDIELNLLDRCGNPVPVLVSYAFIDLAGERCIESAYKNISLRHELEKKLIEQNENLEKSVLERTVDLENQKNLLMKKNQELKAMTEKLKEHKTRLQTLFKAITDTVTVIDTDFNILMCNQKHIGRGKCYKKVFLQEDSYRKSAARNASRKRSSPRGPPSPWKRLWTTNTTCSRLTRSSTRNAGSRASWRYRDSSPRKKTWSVSSFRRINWPLSGSSSPVSAMRSTTPIPLSGATSSSSRRRWEISSPSLTNTTGLTRT